MENKDELISAWLEYKKINGSQAKYTKDAKLLAGCYLEWAGEGGLSMAINAVSVHCSGQYIDMPRFGGCHETLVLLKSLKND